MLTLKDKTILILSPQAWGKMFLSKHHYAIELAKRGNRVFFLNPPDQSGKKKRPSIEIKESGVHPNLWLIEHQLFFPYILKFKAIWIFHWLMKFHIEKLLHQTGHQIDVVWSFDIVNLYPLRFFKNAYKIFHPVDEPLTREALDSGNDAEIIFSVTHEILQKYAHNPAPKHFIHHGVTEKFIAKDIRQQHPADNSRVGFSGNLMRKDIDRDILLRIIADGAAYTFEFWGSYQANQTNIGGHDDDALKDFIRALQAFPNVKLHGAVTPDELADEFKRMDAFLICYDIEREQSKGTNYHKVMEFLATGKVIISNNITTFAPFPDLVQMISSRENNDSLPGLFESVMCKLNEHNAIGTQEKRIAFAKENTYPNQIRNIEQILSQSTL